MVISVKDDGCSTKIRLTVTSEGGGGGGGEGDVWLYIAWLGPPRGVLKINLNYYIFIYFFLTSFRRK